MASAAGSAGDAARTGWRALDGRQRRVVACTLSGNALVFFDQTAVTLALPAIGCERSFSHSFRAAALVAAAVCALAAVATWHWMPARKTDRGIA